MSEELHREAELRGKHIWAAVSAWMITRLGWLVFGHARAAIPELRRLHRSRVLGLHTPQVLGDLALALADLGDLEGARETIKTAIAAADTTWTVGMTAYYHSEIAWASGRPERCLREVEDALKAELPVPIELVTRHVRLWALFELGRPEWDPHLPGAVPPLLKGVAADNEAFRLLCDGSVSEAEQAFRRAATAWAGNIFRSQVRSNWGAAMLQLRLGDKGGAHETLRQLESQATAAELASMVARIRQAARELEPTRQRPSARATLTPREREVLSCVAHGMSSKQVAAALHLSRATVESHVRVAMRKLSAATRLQAAAVAGLLPAIDSLDLSGPEQALLAMLVGGATLADAAVALGTSRRTATRRFARARAALRAR